MVSVGFSDQDTLLALGVVPVGIRDWYGDQPNAVWPWATDELGDAEFWSSYVARVQAAADAHRTPGG